MAEKPKSASPKFAAPSVEVPQAMREFAERGVQQAKDTYAKFKSAAEETTDLLEGSYVTAARGAAEFNLKALDALRINVNAAFDYTRELLASNTLADAVELSSTHLRKQFEALTAQTRDLTAVAQKIATEAAEPIKATVSKIKLQ